MRRPTSATVLALALTGASCLGATDMQSHERKSTTLRLPRNPDVAVQEELEAARRAGTVEAYDRFLSRNAGHSLAKIARRERAALTLPEN